MAERLLVVLYPGVADWEVSFPLFCLRPGIVDTLASTGRSRVVTAMGFEIGVELAGLEAVKVADFDGVYLPGGIDPLTERFPRALGRDEALLGLLREFAASGKAIAAICGAPLVLGAAGLLKGRRFASDITDDTRGWFDGAVRADGDLCVDGKILTASVRATLPFTVELARLLGNEKTAKEIADFFIK
jgi:4-methyl-5(b-hydroxyethyl)-thiazole monophosphate biosynthesis